MHPFFHFLVLASTTCAALAQNELFRPAFHEAPLRIADGGCIVHFFLDPSSLEVFAQNGETVLTELIFPRAGHRKLCLTVEGTPPSVQDVALDRLE